MFQKYLNSNNSNIITIYHVPQKINKIIVLFPAFLESAADKEYFLRRLASVLSGKSILVVQVEPFAHGHSFGLVKDITIEKIINNAIDIAYDLKNNYNKPIILLLNGLYCNIICNKRIRELYDLFLCINHTFIDNEDIYAIEEIRDDYFELGHYIFNDEKLMNMFKRMGSSTYNICSQLFSKKNILSILKYCKNYNYYEKSSIFIYTNNNKIELYDSIKKDKNNYFDFFCDPINIYNLCKKIEELLEIENESSN